MQTIYVDTLLCVNFFIDYIILYSVRKLCKINSKVIRLLPASLTAALLTLGVFLPFYTRIFSVFYRLLSAALIVFIAFGKSKIKGLLLRVAAFIGISLGFSGAVTLIQLTFKPRGVVVWGDAVYLDISPVMLIICTVITFIALSVYRRIKERLHPSARMHRVTVYSDKEEYAFSSMVDTGCNLKEPFSGLPVIIAEKELLGKRCIPENKLRLVPFNTLSGEGLLKAFKPDKIEIDGKELKSGCYIAVSEGKLTNETKSLMGKEITEGL